MINLRTKSLLTEGITGLCSLLIGLTYFIANRAFIFLFAITIPVAQIGAFFYMRNKENDVEDELAYKNRLKAESSTLTIFHLCLLGLTQPSYRLD